MSRRQAPRWDWVLSGPGTGRSGWGSEGDLQEAITACGEHKSGGRGQPLIPGCRSLTAQVAQPWRHDRAFVGAAGSAWSFVNELDAQLWPAGGVFQLRRHHPEAH